MPITDLLERNAKIYANDVALVEVNPAVTEVKRVTWREYELMEPNRALAYRREITWGVFDEKANRFANLLISRGIKKNDIRLFIDQFNASIPIFQDVNTKFGPRYGTGYVPVVFVVNKDGSYYRFSDLSKKSDEQLENLIKELLK